MSSANNPVPTLSALMDTANANWHVFDLGRRITKLAKDDFAVVEDGRAPYPYPIQQKARMAVVFWDKSENVAAQINPFIWFLQFDVDEMGILKLQQRDHFISLVIKELGSKLIDTDDSQQSVLDNHPYSFTPDQNRQAAFNAILKTTLHQPASMYFEHVQAYFAGQIEVDRWQELSIQGIADFVARLASDDNESQLIKLLPELSVQTLAVLAASLEHVQISEQLTTAIIDLQNQKLAEQDNEEVFHLLRCLSGSAAKDLVKTQLTKLLNSAEKLDQTLYIVMAGRFWEYLQETDMLHLFFKQVAENQDQGLFNGLFSDLVAVPSTRTQVLSLLRDPSRPEAISRALGAVFAAKA